jgi:uncharacterized protein (TIGR02687 family)
MSTPITQALADLFQQHRIVFWYDREASMRAEFDGVVLDGVQKVELAGNELGLKHRMMREEPEQRFLVYSPAPAPSDPENWLLDLNLAFSLFHSDPVALYLQELRMPAEYRDLVAAHVDFFKSKERRSRLAKLIEPAHTPQQIRRAMIASLLRVPPDWTEILMALLSKLPQSSEGHKDPFASIQKYGLAVFFWQEIHRRFAYPLPDLAQVEQGAGPRLMDLLLDWFDAYLGKGQTLGAAADLFLSRWQDSSAYQAGFRWASEYCGEVIRVGEVISQYSLEQIGSLDVFEDFDRQAIRRLKQGLLDQTLGASEVRRTLQARRRGFWYEQYAHHYEVIWQAHQLRQAINRLAFPLPQAAKVAERYGQDFHLIDRSYRKLIAAFLHAGEPGELGKLVSQVEGDYLDKFLVPLQQAWDEAIGQAAHWPPAGLPSQQAFFRRHLAGDESPRRKRLVIISDGLRYEAAHELQDLLNHERGYKTQLSLLATALPSITKVGMAALLPHQRLTLDPSQGKILLDGQACQTTEAREKVLQAGFAGNARAMRLDDFMGLPREALREVIKSNELIYVYHNRIDNAGENPQAEKEVFLEVERTFRDLQQCIKRYLGNGGRHVVITADHGFLYQHRGLDSTDVVQPGAQEEVLKKDHRYMLGRRLQATPATRVYASQAVGFDGDWQVMVPKGVHRFPAQGTKRYVHGGGSLQEMTVPMLTLAQVDSDDRRAVDVDVTVRTNRITTNQFSIFLQQRDPVQGQVLPRTLRVGIFGEKDQLISNQHEVSFDSDATEGLQREFKLDFVFKVEAEQYKGKTVYLRLEEPVPGASQRWRTYREVSYQYKVEIARDFDL